MAAGFGGALERSGEKGGIFGWPFAPSALEIMKAGEDEAVIICDGPGAPGKHSKGVFHMGWTLMSFCLWARANGEP